ncbi:MAG TPA: hypothetical protein VE131_11080 [Terriglobales bacterium]|nr:hypothetical protein [Terriglobales bacterium]
MIRAEFKKSLLDQHGASVILWCFFFASIFIYIVIAQLVVGGRGFPINQRVALSARVILWLLVFVDFGYLVWWKKRYLSRETMLEASSKTKVFRVLQGHSTPQEKTAAAVVSTYVTRKIAAFAIVEAIAVYGLLIALVGRYFWDQYLLSGLSLALLIMEFPSKSSLEDLVRRLEIIG